MLSVVEDGLDPQAAIPTHHLRVGAPDVCQHGCGPLPGMAAAGPERRPDGVLPEAAAAGAGPPA
ncbi:PLEKHM1 isoform 10 [Pongo abelii]|uniref:PLEKHM1 isoform 10 n=1 Tax=Pongo abelii TaxID=9601 RepID=A0A2J8UYX5_PONAB|nr:PLEKHM1 isoform 3 [Pongo abelii]PNJ50479.1 PLEKHM1 isoform 10 [Pongo abelii]